MDDVLRGEFVAARELGFARGAAAESAAFREKFGAGRPMDRAIHSPAAEEAVVGGVDDGIHVESGDVAFHHFKLAGHGGFLPAFQATMRQRCRQRPKRRETALGPVTAGITHRSRYRAAMAGLVTGGQADLRTGM